MEMSESEAASAAMRSHHHSEDGDISRCSARTGSDSSSSSRASTWTRWQSLISRAARRQPSRAWRSAAPQQFSSAVWTARCASSRWTDGKLLFDSRARIAAPSPASPSCPERGRRSQRRVRRQFPAAPMVPSRCGTRGCSPRRHYACSPVHMTVRPCPRCRDASPLVVVVRGEGADDGEGPQRKNGGPEIDRGIAIRMDVCICGHNRSQVVSRRSRFCPE